MTMQATGESAILADVLNSTRILTNYYLHKAQGLDFSKRFEVNGFTTNSIHWIVAHLAWAEYFLVLKAVGNHDSDVPEWFDLFSIGAPFPALEEMPSYEEAFQAFKDMHLQSLELIKSVQPEELDQPNHLGIKFGGSDSKRMIIHHCIRHEGTHTGHLGWLLRMHGNKVV
ncbi:MAG: DinB family protein [Sphingobacteriales bacterium]|nr:MAG: DinB family protein [Sphingobacteriales bacterium]